MTEPYYRDEMVTLYLGDFRELAPQLPVVDAVLSDPPYGMTDSKWDTKVDTSWLIDQCVSLTPHGTVAFTTSQPFSSEVVLAAGKRFRHEWIWQKNAGSNFGTVKWHPMKEHESVIVVAARKGRYFPIMQERTGGGLARVQSGVVNYSAMSRDGLQKGRLDQGGQSLRPDLRYPSSVQRFNRERGLHPTQKPVALFDYLTRTYTLEGETVLDPFAGSGTTLLAAALLGRKSIGVEIEEKFAEVIAMRMEGRFNHPQVLEGSDV